MKPVKRGVFMFVSFWLISRCCFWI